VVIGGVEEGDAADKQWNRRLGSYALGSSSQIPTKLKIEVSQGRTLFTDSQKEHKT